jgi:uncharacterized protein (UPF0548 family)
MQTLRRPRDAAIAAFAAREAGASFTYPEVGATRSTMPAGYRIDRAEFELGRGAAAFAAATTAMRGFEMYGDPSGKIRLCPPRPTFAEGALLILLAHHLGVWTLSACRIVYVIDEPRRVGFAYGTLEHAVRGEELFEIRHGDDDRVTFHLSAFSVPATLLVRLATPITRHYQREGGRSYARALMQALGR